MFVDVAGRQLVRAFAVVGSALLALALVAVPAAQAVGSSPAPPTDVYTEPAGIGAIYIAWSDGDAAATSYTFTGSGKGLPVTVPAGDVEDVGYREYVVSGLDPNEYYKLSVRANNSGGSSAAVSAPDYVPGRPNSGNLSYNSTFDDGLSYWSSLNGAVARVPLAFQGGKYVAKVTRSKSTTYNLSDSANAGMVPTIPYAAAGTSYLVSAWVRAASNNAVGKPVYAAIRERNASLAVVRDTKGALKKLSSKWQKIWVQAPVLVAQDSIGVRFEQGSAVAGNALYVADVQVQQVGLVTQLGSPQTAGPLTPNVKRVAPMYFAVCSDNSPSVLEPCDFTYQITEIRAWVDGLAGGKGSQPLRALVYAEGFDYSNAPTQLLASSNTVSVKAGQKAGWVTFTLNQPLEIKTWGEYYFGLHAGGTSNVVRYYGDQSFNDYGGNYTYEFGAYNKDAFGDGPAASFGVPTPAQSTTFVELRGAG
jgi:hypothetical protein